MIASFSDKFLPIKKFRKRLKRLILSALELIVRPSEEEIVISRELALSFPFEKSCDKPPKWPATCQCCRQIGSLANRPGPREVVSRRNLWRAEIRYNAFANFETDKIIFFRSELCAIARLQCLARKILPIKLFHFESSNYLRIHHLSMAKCWLSLAPQVCRLPDCRCQVQKHVGLFSATFCFGPSLG